MVKSKFNLRVTRFILLHEKFLQCDWLRAVVFQRNLKYLDVSYFVKTLKSWVTNYSLILSRNFSVYTTTSEISAI